MLGALGAWVVSRERRPLNQPTYLLFAVFIVVGMVTMVVNGWVGGALVRFLEFLPPLFALLLVAQASHSPKNCFRIMWMISRSEEHTSELQSLMRISYAVFCLKKKNRQENIQTTLPQN